jgi:hypothetical protein
MRVFRRLIFLGVVFAGCVFASLAAVAADLKVKVVDPNSATVPGARVAIRKQHDLPAVPEKKTVGAGLPLTFGGKSKAPPHIAGR